ncbi:metallophosphoesterase family protein [Hymenobacter terrenus]|uniref:metallophosphoesterase family protein n=1 Tax=Hymenobacter terrenus TaxID=1629124 RepID=UPI0006979AD2|nr:metallophosphoesterase [Hymenobacter terrenus]
MIIAALFRTFTVPLLLAVFLLSSQQALAQRFAAIGDYGFAGEPNRDVAQLVKSWNPDFIITMGDNNYDRGAANTIDANIGQYYHEFIAPYRGSYGPGASENRFFPCLGNHDLYTKHGRPYRDYFTLPGNERYYDFVRGQVHFFVLNSASSGLHGNRATSRQARWLRKQLAAAREPWKVVYFHHAPYSSGQHGSTVAMRWPFRAWGASLVLSGHDHHYERLVEDGLLYCINGLGGRSIYNVALQPMPGSLLRYNSDYGAQLFEASADSLRLRFYTRTGQLVDSFTLRKELSVEPALENVVSTPMLETARITFSIPATDTVQLRVLDVAGREVARLFDGPSAAGHHELLWSQAALLPGLYYLQLRSGAYAPVLRPVAL